MDLICLFLVNISREIYKKRNFYLPVVCGKSFYWCCNIIKLVPLIIRQDFRFKHLTAKLKSYLLRSVSRFYPRSTTLSKLLVYVFKLTMLPMVSKLVHLLFLDMQLALLSFIAVHWNNIGFIWDTITVSITNIFQMILDILC